MADLVKVQFKGGGEGKVSREWVERWPDDIAAVLDDAEPTPAPSTDASPTEGEKAPVDDAGKSTPEKSKEVTK